MNGYTVGNQYTELLRANPIRRQALYDACGDMCKYCNPHKTEDPGVRKLVLTRAYELGHATGPGDERRKCSAREIWARIRVEFPEG